MSPRKSARSTRKPAATRKKAPPRKPAAAGKPPAARRPHAARKKPAGKSPPPGPTPRPPGLRYWLLKSEPETFSIADLARAPRQTTCWDGVRNYQARNFLRDALLPGDRVLFYHSSTDVPAVVGLCTVVRGGYPDDTAFQPDHPHYDPRSRPEAPTWYMVDVRLDERFVRPVPLEALRKVPALAGMMLLQRGSRLSVQPVTAAEFATVVALGQRDACGLTSE